MSAPRTREEACDILELPLDSANNAVIKSYKRLALKWHPEQHSESAEAKKKFQIISKAYKKLTSGSSSEMSYEGTLKLFKDVFFSKSSTNTPQNGLYHSSDDDDESDSEDDEEYDIHLNNNTKNRTDISSHGSKSEDAKNSEEFNEQEKERRKADKRRAKKKRRKEKKKVEKLEGVKEVTLDDKKSSKQKKNAVDNIKKCDKKNTESRSSDEADFDPTSAFFVTVVNKKKKNQNIQDMPSNGKDRKTKSNGEEQSDDLDPVILRSRQLAIRGNEMAQLGQYSAAIQLFSEAIHLDTGDFRFFGNRSYCYDRTQMYEKALKDAEKAISLSPDWPKGYFRKGRALAGLKLFPDAERSFMQVLKLDKNCDEAVLELLHVRTYQITEMGFSQKQAEAAIKQFGAVQTALDSLLAGVVADQTLNNNDIHTVDEESALHIQNSPKRKMNKPCDIKMDPRNPDGLTALWVGNVLPDIKEKQLVQLFSKFGTVTSVRCLPEKYCAFINFKTKESAGKAMTSLQSHECGGQRLLVKFPDNPICEGLNGVTTLRKTSNTNLPTVAKQDKAKKEKEKEKIEREKEKEREKELEREELLKNLPKQTGPVNGDECYFWRTTGCQFADKCHYKHIPDHRGVDKKPWQRVK